jgi:type IV pilus biogenesis protein CpaD/CtpE
MNVQATVLLAGLAVAACNTPADTPPAEFGEAVHNNMAAHIIDPQPPASMELPPADGVRRSLMISRYQLDKVETPREPTTSTIQIDTGGSK